MARLRWLFLGAAFDTNLTLELFPAPGPIPHPKAAVEILSQLRPQESRGTGFVGKSTKGFQALVSHISIVSRAVCYDWVSHVLFSGFSSWPEASESPKGQFQCTNPFKFKSDRGKCASGSLASLVPPKGLEKKQAVKPHYIKFCADNYKLHLPCLILNSRYNQGIT